LKSVLTSVFTFEQVLTLFVSGTRSNFWPHISGIFPLENGTSTASLFMFKPRNNLFFAHCFRCSDKKWESRVCYFFCLLRCICSYIKCEIHTKRGVYTHDTHTHTIMLFMELYMPGFTGRYIFYKVSLLHKYTNIRTHKYTNNFLQFNSYSFFVL